MNANELADELLKVVNVSSHVKECAADMLIRQQAKIDNLLENNARLDAEIEGLKHDNAELVKINNELATEVVHPTQEPVAWCRKDTVMSWEGQILNVAWMFPSPKGLKNPIPLYTHPVKELTPCEELRAFQEQQNGVFSGHNACCYRHECRIVWNDWEKIRSNPAELTDEDILKIWRENEKVYPMDRSRILDRSRACIRKAQESNNEQVPDFFFMENDLMGKR